MTDCTRRQTLQRNGRHPVGELPQASTGSERLVQCREEVTQAANRQGDVAGVEDESREISDRQLPGVHHGAPVVQDKQHDGVAGQACLMGRKVKLEFARGNRKNVWFEKGGKADKSNMSVRSLPFGLDLKEATAFALKASGFRMIKCIYSTALLLFVFANVVQIAQTNTHSHRSSRHVQKCTTCRQKRNRCQLQAKTPHRKHCNAGSRTRATDYLITPFLR